MSRFSNHLEVKVKKSPAEHMNNSIIIPNKKILRSNQKVGIATIKKP